MLAPRFNPQRTGGAPSTAESYDLPPVIADHKLIRCIGEGSYGRVYLARNELTGAFRALKIVFRDAFSDPKPYMREFEAICNFEPISRSHPSFVQILHVGKLESAFYYIMELGDDPVSGPDINPETYRPRTLGLTRGEILPVERCIEIGSSLADCLAVLHSRGLIHRDIKPSNIIFVDSRPKLADIGLVTQIEEARSLVGTAGFMPPEGPISPASDIYSLGKVLYEIATGKDRCEFPELPLETVADNALHLELNQILLRACHPKPNKRYASAEEIKHELDLLNGGKSIKRLRQLERRFRLLKISFGISVVLVIGMFLVYSQIKAKREAVERERQRLAGYLLAQGTAEMRKGDLGRALPFFIRAAEYDPRDMPSHQLRIGSVDSLVPRIKKRWRTLPRGEFSADASLLVVPDGFKVQIFSSETGDEIDSYRFNEPISKAILSPDASNIAALSGQRLVILNLSGLDRAEHLFPHELRDAAFNPKNSRVAVSMTNGAAFYFDPATLNLQPLVPEGHALNISFDFSGKKLITSSDYKGFSHLRNGFTGETLAGPILQEYPYRGVFSPDGQVVVITGWTSAIPVKVVSGELAGDTMDNDDAVVHAAFSPKGKILATANYDGTVRLWDAKSFDPVQINHILEHESRPVRVAFLNEETLVTHCIDGENYVWDLGTRKREPVPVEGAKRPDPLRIMEEGVDLAANGQEIEGTIGTNRIQVRYSAEVSALAVSPNRTSFGAGSKDSLFERTHASLYHLSDLSSPIRLNHKDGINHITYSHLGDKLATSSEDFSAIIWDANSGRQLTRPMRHRWQVMWAAFDQFDQWLVTAGADAVCIVWDVKSGEPLTAPLDFPSQAHFVTFEPGNASILVGDKTTNFYRMQLPIATLPLNKYAENLPALLEPLREHP